MSRILPAFLVVLAACGDLEPVDVHTLEASTVLAECDAQPCEASGALSLSAGAEEGDWELSVGELTASIHSAARSDLSAFSGAEATLVVGEGGLNEGSGPAALEDADGLVWLSQSSAGEDLAAGYVGQGFARYADEVVASGRSSSYDLEYHDVVFATDDGEVTVAAGTPTVLKVGGVSYRAVVVAAYTTEVRPGEPVADCGGLPDLLAYELVRVETEERESPLVRPADKGFAAAGCGG